MEKCRKKTAGGKNPIEEAHGKGSANYCTGWSSAKWLTETALRFMEIAQGSNLGKKAHRKCYLRNTVGKSPILGAHGKTSGEECTKNPRNWSSGQNCGEKVHGGSPLRNRARKSPDDITPGWWPSKIGDGKSTGCGVHGKRHGKEVNGKNLSETAHCKSPGGIVHWKSSSELAYGKHPGERTHGRKAPAK